MCAEYLRARLALVRRLAALLLCMGLGSPAAAALQVIDRADITVTAATGTAIGPQSGKLPLQWDRQFGARDGQVRFAMQVAVADTAVPLALYIPRIGTTFTVHFNGQDVAHFGTLPPNGFDDAAMQPRYLEVPPYLLQRSNTLEITLGIQGGRAGGLSTLTAGAPSEVYPVYASAHFWQISGARVVAVVSAVLGLLALLLWLRQREAAYLYYGLGELLWSLQTSRVLFEHAPLSWPWWGVIPLAAFNAAPPLLFKFALAVMGQGRGRVARAVDALIVLAVPVAFASIFGGVVALGPLWQGVIVLTSIAVAAQVLRTAAASHAWEARVLAIAIALIVLGALRDILAIRLAPDTYALVPWTRFTWVGFGIALAWIIAERMRRDRKAIAAMNTTLSAQLAARDAELTAAFERERGSEKERGAVEERQRLMRDLHDGLGSQLVGALRVAQQPSATREEIGQQLREAIDQLKVTVDAMQETDGDIATALGTVRYRLAPRLQAAAIDLYWDVNRRLPVRGDWGPRQSFQLQMILLEAFTNMMVHARATEASLSARPVEVGGVSSVQIDICDNGTGFVAGALATPAGQGLSNMRARATALGATLQVESAPGQTRIRLLIPAR